MVLGLHFRIVYNLNMVSEINFQWNNYIHSKVMRRDGTAHKRTKYIVGVAIF